MSVPSPFQFLGPSRIRFGVDASQDLARETAALGRRALLVTGASVERYSWCVDALAEDGLGVFHVRAGREPTIDDCLGALAEARETRPDVVVAVGGGSALDLGKALAALLPNDGDPFEHLEVVGRGRPLVVPALPLVAVPTTSGPGSEATKNAVLTAEAEGVKVSLRDDSMLPRLALVDPRLTVGTDASVTAATGLDAITQCLEPLVSRHSNPLTDGLAREGLRRGFFALRRVLEDGSDLEGRSELSLCSLFGGLALANAKLGAVHGFAAPLGGRYPAPHGALCARLLPLVVEVNVRALRARAPASPSLRAYSVVAELLSGGRSSAPESAHEPLAELVAAVQIPSLAAYGVEPSALPDLVARARRASSMAGNPLELTDEELFEILERAL